VQRQGPSDSGPQQWQVSVPELVLSSVLARMGHCITCCSIYPLTHKTTNFKNLHARTSKTILSIIHPTWHLATSTSFTLETAFSSLRRTQSSPRVYPPSIRMALTGHTSNNSCSCSSNKHNIHNGIRMISATQTAPPTSHAGPSSSSSNLISSYNQAGAA